MRGSSTGGVSTEPTLAATPSPRPSPSSPRPVLLPEQTVAERMTGISHTDDAMAIIMAATSDSVELLGLTTCFGNVPADLATRNALSLLERRGRPYVPPTPPFPLFRRPCQSLPEQSPSPLPEISQALIAAPWPLLHSGVPDGSWPASMAHRPLPPICPRFSSSLPWGLPSLAHYSPSHLALFAFPVCFPSSLPLCTPPRGLHASRLPFLQLHHWDSAV